MFGDNGGSKIFKSNVSSLLKDFPEVNLYLEVAVLQCVFSTYFFIKNPSKFLLWSNIDIHIESCIHCTSF